MGLKDKIRGTYLRLLDISGTNWLCRALMSGRGVILYYHGISADESYVAAGTRKRHAPVEMFRRHMEFMRADGYRFVTMTEMAHALARKASPARKLATLTFDDGFRNVVRNAYPLMREYGAKGCIYVVHDIVGTGRLFLPSWLDTQILANPAESFDLELPDRKIELDLRTPAFRQKALGQAVRAIRDVPELQKPALIEKLTSRLDGPVLPEEVVADWDELRGLDADVLEVGSHTCTHPELTRLTEEQSLDREIGYSREAIARAMGRPVDHFCYPRGRFDDRVVAKVAQCGYMTATTTVYGLNARGADLLRLRRVREGGTMTGFRANLSGAFGTYVWLAGKARRVRAGDGSI